MIRNSPSKRAIVALFICVFSGLLATESLMAQSSVTIQQRVIIRIPLQPAPPPPPDEAKPEERKTGNCLPVSVIRRATVSEADSVDFVLRSGVVIRAQFHNQCQALDFYSGIYFRPTEDGLICANRDVLRARSGISCDIKRFRLLIFRPIRK